MTSSNIAIFVDRTKQRWIVRDTEGAFWVMPPVTLDWNHREPLNPEEEKVELEPIPTHYKYQFNIPF